MRTLWPSDSISVLTHIAIWIFIISIDQQDLHAQDIDSLLRNKRIFHTVHIGGRSAPRIDGELDDHAWELVRWQGYFIQQFPFGGRPSTEQTFVKVVYDHSNLYVAMVCRDSELEYPGPAGFSRRTSRRSRKGSRWLP